MTDMDVPYGIRYITGGTFEDYKRFLIDEKEVWKLPPGSPLSFFGNYDELNKFIIPVTYVRVSDTLQSIWLRYRFAEGEQWTEVLSTYGNIWYLTYRV